jgi:hypothetical protein
VNVMHECLDKNVLGYVLANFSQMNLVTLPFPFLLCTMHVLNSKPSGT